MSTKTKVPKGKKELMEVILDKEPKAFPNDKKELMEAVLDTNILISDPTSLLQFKKHDVTITSIVIDELDTVKKKNPSKAGVITQVLVMLENFAKTLSTKKIGEPALYNEGVSLGKNKGTLRVVKVDLGLESEVSNFYSAKKTDHLILNSILELQKRRDNESKENKVPSRKVVLITKDRNLRIKAGTLGIPAEDYKNDKLDINYVLGNNVLVHKKLESVIGSIHRHPVSIEAIKGIVNKDTLFPNKYLILKKNKEGNECLCKISPDGKQLKQISEKLSASKINPRNTGQLCALDAGLSPNNDLVLLEGPAGSGKTLMAMAAGLEWMKPKDSIYQEMILTSAMVAVNDKNMGALPGNAQSKVLPYMQGMMRNLELIKKASKVDCKVLEEVKQIDATKTSGKRKTPKRTPKRTQKDAPDKKEEYQEGTSIKFFDEQIIIQPIAFVRGATFDNAIIIVDECQNLENNEAKAIVTRAGINSKMFLCGDVSQIDIKYLDRTSNGLTHVIKQMKGYEFVAFVRLPKGERSRLATLASEVL